MCMISLNRQPFAHPVQERGNANAQSWSASVEAALGGAWARLGLRQLSGMLILVYVRKKFLVRRPGRRTLAWNAC